VQLALLDAIRAKPAPTCPISLDDLVLPSGRLEKNVAMIVQRPPEGRPHVFLYKQAALERWFADSRVPTNPLTRQILDTKRDYLPIS
jgi:hypothetical protein